MFMMSANAACAASLWSVASTHVRFSSRVKDVDLTRTIDAFAYTNGRGGTEVGREI